MTISLVSFPSRTAQVESLCFLHGTTYVNGNKTEFHFGQKEHTGTEIFVGSNHEIEGRKFRRKGCWIACLGRSTTMVPQEWLLSPTEKTGHLGHWSVETCLTSMETWLVCKSTDNISCWMVLRARVLGEMLCSPRASPDISATRNASPENCPPVTQPFPMPAHHERRKESCGNSKLRKEWERIRCDMGSTKTQSSSQVLMVSTLQISPETT